MIVRAVAIVATGRHASDCTTKTGCSVVGRTTRVGADGGGDANAIVGVGGAWACGSRQGVEVEAIGGTHEATGWVV